MSKDPTELLKLDDGSSLITSTKQDEYWVLDPSGGRRKISLQEACQIWIKYHDAEVGSHPLHDLAMDVAPHVAAQAQRPKNNFSAPPRSITRPPRAKLPPQPPPIPAPRPLQEESERESWSDSLLRKLGMDSSSIGESVAADRYRAGG